MPMAALRLLAVLAYCLCRRALPSTFFRPAWPGINAGQRREPEKMPMAALRLLALDIFQARLARYACVDDRGFKLVC